MVLPSRRVVTSPALRSTARCWLMLGTWQPTRSLRSVTDSSPMASDSRTHSRFGIRERPTDRGVAQSLGLGRDRQAIQHPANHIIACANTQVRVPCERRARVRHAYTRGHVRRRRAICVPLAEIEAARERIAGLVHRTPAPQLGDGRGLDARRHRARDPATTASILKAEHLQKTGSFKARGMTNRIATLPDGGPGARGHHAVGRECGAGVRVGRPRRRASR